MIIELGHFALILAFAVAILQAIIPLIGAQKRWPGWMAFAVPAANAQFFLTAFAFGALTYAFVVSDFSVRLVTLNSHTAKPMLYKVAGVWGNHEGSMLLWVLILTLFGACAAWFGGNLPPGLRARVLAVQSSIAAAFFGFILFTSNPFLRLQTPPFNGQDLNPLLQDPGLAFHPPFLYLGYVGLSMAFSFAVAALIEGRVDAAWARWVRPWTLAAWIFLTIGIAMGSWWAYYELGWGGFWFWDPVENASFMPWLIATALLHSAIVVEKRESLKSWTILLSILAFGFSLIGTFIVRSGVLTSVHAFASDPSRGVFVLFILAFFTGGALVLYAIRAQTMEAKGVFSMASRETALVINNILLAVAAFVVFIGTIWPLVAEIAFGRKLSVGAPFFNMAFTPFMVVLAVVLPVGAILAWKRARLKRAMKTMSGVFALALAAGLLTWAMQSGRSALGPVGIGLGVWLVFGAGLDLWMRTGWRNENPVRVVLGVLLIFGAIALSWIYQGPIIAVLVLGIVAAVFLSIRRGQYQPKVLRLFRLSRADWGKALAHGGLGIAILGIACLTAWSEEDIRVGQLNEPFTVGDYEINLVEVHREQGPNYISTIGEMTVKRDGKLVTTLFPEKRVYPVQGMPTTEAAIYNGFLRDIYLVIGDEQDGGGWAVRTYIKPFASWIWFGCLLMALGGIFSLTDRRYRVAAGARKARQSAAMAPAE